MGLFRPRRPGAQNPARPPQTAAQRPTAGRNSGGGGGAVGYSRSRFEEMSLKRFIQALREVPDEIEQARRDTSRRTDVTVESIRARAAVAEEGTPISKEVAAELYSIAVQVEKAQEEHDARVRALQERAGNVQSMAAHNHQADAERWDSPRRGSHHIEAKADNQAARRDT